MFSNNCFVRVPGIEANLKETIGLMRICEMNLPRASAEDVW